MPRILAVVLLGLMPAALPRCAGSMRADPAELALMPDDFTLDVSVVAGRAVSEQSGSHLQPMRYVVMPDGTLRSGPTTDGATLSADSLPGVTRILTRQQMDSLWALVRDAGLVDPERREPPMNLALFTAPDDRMIYLAQFQAANVNWSVRGPAPLVPVDSTDSTSAPSTGLTDSISSIDPTLTVLVKRLAALAWVSDQPASAMRPAPIRYEFGPDPYARYREP